MAPTESDRAFIEALQACRRPLLFLAHQDDELGCTWVLQKLQDRIQVVFMTNGEGSAPRLNEDPVRYAALRKQEALNSLGAAGLKAEQVHFLGYSEIEIYRNLGKLKLSSRFLPEVVSFFDPIRRDFDRVVHELEPDAVFVVAYQGGRPEHDLAHYFASLALRRSAGEGGARVPLYHFPEYELAVLLPMRFRPWYPGSKYWLELSPREAKKKKAMADCYPSQRKRVRKFRLVAGLLTLPQWIRTGADPLDRFFGCEQISPVPDNFDYCQPPHGADFLNYVLEDFQGVPITFRDCIRPVVSAFEKVS